MGIVDARALATPMGITDVRALATPMGITDARRALATPMGMRLKPNMSHGFELISSEIGQWRRMYDCHAEDIHDVGFRT